MKTDIVVFKNEFNTVPLRNFNSLEMDLLFTIMSQTRDTGNGETTLTFEELKDLSNWNRNSTMQNFVNDLERTYDKLIQLNVKIGTSKEWTKFVFFTRYAVNIDKESVSIQVNPEFQHLINELTGNFTKLELEEVTELRSSYAKSMYRLLKQYRSTGFFNISMDEFRKLLDVPNSYKMPNIRQRVFKPIMNELPQHFDGLSIEEVKGSGKEKRRVIALKFSFLAQPNFREDKRGKVFETIRDGNKYTNYYPGDEKPKQQTFDGVEIDWDKVKFSDDE